MNPVIEKCADAVNCAKNMIDDKLNESGISTDAVISAAIKIPGVKIDREKFLKKELFGYFPESVIDTAIARNPAFAGVPKEFISTVAKKTITYETNKVSAISFVAGIPGGVAMAATVPADTAQYFGFMIRIVQKLAYLYGYGEFNFDDEELKDDTMNQLLIFLGVMLGVQGANAGVKIIAQAAAQRVAKNLPRQALMKGAIYPVVKKIALKIGIQMNKTIFAKGVSKIIPVAGGFITGGMTFASFRISANRLRKTFEDMPICDENSEFYNHDIVI